MARPEEALYTRLSGFAGLTGLVSTRTYPVGEVPQDATLPYVAYRRNGREAEKTIGGSIGMAWALFEITTRAADYDDGKAIAEQLRLALDDWTDAAASPIVLDCWLDDERDEYDDEVKLHSIVQQFRLMHRE